MRWLVTIVIVLLAVAVANWELAQLVLAIPFNWYTLRTYLPLEVLNHYIERPLSDVELVVPVHFFNEFTLPDLYETIDIQVEARMREEFSTLPDFKIQLLNGDRDEYNHGGYPKDELFVGSVLSSSNGIHIDGARNFAEQYYTLESLDNNDFPFFLTQLLIDHCFRDEIEKYTPDSFYKVNDGKADNEEHFNLIHADYMDHPIVKAMIDGTDGEPAKVKLKFYVVASDLINLNLEFTVLNTILPRFDKFRDFVQFEVSIQNLLTVDPDVPSDLHYIDDKFPRELTDLPLLSQLYESTVEHDDNNTVHFVFYPFPQGGERIKAKVVDGNDIYSETENTFLNIDNWGSVYFSHIPEAPEVDAEEIKLAFSVRQLEDCMWSFMESLLDGLGVPCDSLAPSVRLTVWKRYLCVQNIVHFSTKLAKVRSILYGGGVIPPSQVREMVQSVLKGLSLRLELLRLLREHRLDEALPLSIDMIRTIRV